MRKPNFKHSLLLGTSIATFAWAAAPALAQNNNGSGNETVIVTGTRVQGMTAADSAAPITVLGSEALTKGTGSTDLRQALGQTIPSFTAQQFGGDTANLTLSAALRGLSPNDTLVLINGHRRHYTGNLHVDAGGFAAGSSSADLSFIPEAAIDHVEVLLDGAAAQYGTDAIAGVVNIILKKKSSGGQASVTAGNYYNQWRPRHCGRWRKLRHVLQYGHAAVRQGLLQCHGRKILQQFHPIWRRRSPLHQCPGQSGGAADRHRLQLRPASPRLSPGNNIPNSFLPFVKGYPRSNTIDGNPEVQSTMAEFNSAYDFSDSMQLYAFGTYGHKFAKSFENERLPNQVIATIGSNQPCSATNPNGYNTGSTTANGLDRGLHGRFPDRRFVVQYGPGRGPEQQGPHHLRRRRRRHQQRRRRQPVQQHADQCHRPASRLPSPTGAGALEQRAGAGALSRRLQADGSAEGRRLPV